MCDANSENIRRHASTSGWQHGCRWARCAATGRQAALLPERAVRAVPPAGSTNAIRSPLISMWSSCDVATDLPRYPFPPGRISHRWLHAAAARNNRSMPGPVRFFRLKVFRSRAQKLKDSDYSSIVVVRNSSRLRFRRNSSFTHLPAPRRNVFCNK